MEGTLKMIVGWGYDKDRGCWFLDPDSTAKIIADAEQLVGKPIRMMSHPEPRDTVMACVLSDGSLRYARTHEFGYGVTMPENSLMLSGEPRERLVQLLANTMRGVWKWSEPPTIRRGMAASATRMSPEVVYYGIGLHRDDVMGEGCPSCKKPDAALDDARYASLYWHGKLPNQMPKNLVPPMPLVEQALNCNKPNHAPGCICATFGDTTPRERWMYSDD